MLLSGGRYWVEELYVVDLWRFVCLGLASCTMCSSSSHLSYFCCVLLTPTHTPTHPHTTPQIVHLVNWIRELIPAPLFYFYSGLVPWCVFQHGPTNNLPQYSSGAVHQGLKAETSRQECVLMGYGVEEQIKAELLLNPSSC